MKQIEHLEFCLQASLLQSDYQHIFTAVNSSYRHVYHKRRNIQIQKFLALQNVDYQTTTNQKFVLNLSYHVFTNAKEMAPQKGLNFGVAGTYSNLDMACAAESVAWWHPNSLQLLAWNTSGKSDQCCKNQSL
jgi:hypothetical protein